MHAAEAVAHLAQAFPGDAAEQKQCFQVSGCAFLIGARRKLHRAGRSSSMPGESLTGQWQTESRADTFGQSSVVEEHERVPCVEEHRPENLSRALRPERSRRAQGLSSSQAK